MQSFLKYIQLPKGIFPKIFIIGAIATIFINLLNLNKEHTRILNLKKLMPHQIIGHKLAGLENYTKDIAIMGYYTDAAEGDEAQAKLFSYAQYLLAPTILDYNNLNHEYILFVCQNENVAKVLMQEINAEPLKQNPSGMILARKRL